jgi:phage tail sheath protein FI
MQRSFTSLSVKRLCVSITNAIDNATRWAVFEPDAVQAASRIQSQVHAYMCYLADAGAFVDDAFMVQCHAEHHSHPIIQNRGITILLGFHPTGSDEPVSLTLHQTVSGCRVATTAFAPANAEVA